MSGLAGPVGDANLGPKFASTPPFQRTPLLPDPTSIQITGRLAAAGNARGAYPVRVVSQVANAVWMRLGNTAEELQLADWRAYSDDVAWLLPTGQQPKVVHDLHGRRMDRITAKVSQEIPVLLKHGNANASTRQAQPQHHTGGAATGDDALAICGLCHCARR